MFYIEVKRFWKILYTFTCRYFIQIISVKEKEIGICGALLSTVSVLKPILSDAHFCLPYEKINCCKIAYTIWWKTLFSLYLCFYFYLLFKKYCLKTKWYISISDFPLSYYLLSLGTSMNIKNFIYVRYLKHSLFTVNFF